MTKIVLALVATLALTGAAMADYKLDDKGKCHDDHGKFAKAAMCERHEMHSYKLDNKGKCHDEKGKFAKANLCHA